MSLIGWITAAVFAVLLFVVIAVRNTAGTAKDTEMPKESALKSITFYDSDKNEVLPEALWYNSAQIEGILVQWEGVTPDNIKMFATPSGSGTMDKTELLLTKNVLDGACVELLDADVLKDKFQVHVFFQLEFGDEIIKSEVYNIFYDESWYIE